MKIKEDFIRQSIEKGKVVKKVTRDGVHVKNDVGDLIPISMISVPIYDPKKNKVIGAVMTMIDVSKESELDRVRDEFVYVIAHELGSPITAVEGYLSLIMDSTKKKIAEKDLDMIESAIAANRQLATLVNDLLEVIRSESGQMKFSLEPTDLTDIAKDVVDGLRIKAKDKKIVITLDSKSLPKINSNYPKLREILTNLVDNAIKYSPEGSKVKVSFEKEEGYITTSVKDNGFGMSKAEAKNLFNKFYRIQNSDTKGIPGTGLGLFIVKQLIDKMGSKIWVESEKGKGSTFSFKLKIAKSK